MKLFKVVHESFEDATLQSTTQEKLVTATDFETCCKAEIAHLEGYGHAFTLKAIIECGDVVANHVKADQ